MTDHLQPDLLADLLAHERRVWDALVHGDAAADHALLADDFLGVYFDGFAGKADHTGQLVNGPTVQSYSLDNPRARPLGPDHAILSYRATFRRVQRTTDEIMFVSSIWQRDATGWINVFSQDTPAQP